MRPEFIVAAKEFKDNLNSKRFLILFGLLALLSIIGAISGISSYNSSLAEYNSNLQRVGSAVGGMRFMVDMPSILEIFNSYGTYIASFGMLLAISMGFDLISREKEEGTLKILLTHPVFRDQVINGKILGSVAMMIVVLLSTFLAITAIMLFFGIVPSGDDIVRLAVFFAVVVLFLLAYLAIAVMSSTLSKSSSMAMLIAIAIVLVGMVIPSVSSTVATAVLGDAPQMTIMSANGTASGSNGPVFFEVSGLNQTDGSQNRTMGTPMQINPEYTEYYSKYNTITGILNVLSPSQDFTTISEVINGRLASTATIGTSGGDRVGFFQRESGTTATIWESLGSVWMNILALLVMIVAGFGISYMRFIREDVK